MVGSTQKSSSASRLAPLFALLAFLACNGTLILIAVLSAIGISISINPHLQAAAIALFAVATLLLVFRGLQKTPGPRPANSCRCCLRYLARHHVHSFQQAARIHWLAGTFYRCLMELAAQPPAPGARPDLTIQSRRRKRLQQIARKTIR